MGVGLGAPLALSSQKGEPGDQQDFRQGRAAISSLTLCGLLRWETVRGVRWEDSFVSEESALAAALLQRDQPISSPPPSHASPRVLTLCTASAQCWLEQLCKGPQHL